MCACVLTRFAQWLGAGTHMKLKCLPMTACFWSKINIFAGVCGAYCFARGRIPFLKPTSNNKPAHTRKTRTLSLFWQGSNSINATPLQSASQNSKHTLGVLSYKSWELNSANDVKYKNIIMCCGIFNNSIIGWKN